MTIGKTEKQETHPRGAKACHKLGWSSPNEAPVVTILGSYASRREPRQGFATGSHGQLAASVAAAAAVAAVYLQGLLGTVEVAGVEGPHRNISPPFRASSQPFFRARNCSLLPFSLPLSLQPPTQYVLIPLLSFF